MHLGVCDLLTVHVERERGVLDNLAAEDEDEVVPLALLHDVGEPHPGPPLPGELGLPVIVLVSGRLLTADDDSLVPGREVTLV